MKCFFDTCDEAVSHAAKSKGFGLFHSKTGDPNLNIHVHECCEILLCISGGKSFLIDDRVYDMNDGDLFMINQFEAHKVSHDAETGFERYIMHIHPTFLYANSVHGVNLSDCFYRNGGVNRLSLSESERKELTTLFGSFRAEQSYGDELFKKLRATEVLLTVNRLFSTHGDSSAGKMSHRAIQLAIDYINTNYSQELTLDAVAKNSYVSVNQLCRLFNRYCGTTVTKYIISKRITEAKKLLSEGKSVTDTAFMCGFNDYANFIKSFKKTVGVPPGKYKNSQL